MTKSFALMILIFDNFTPERREPLPIASNIPWVIVFQVANPSIEYMIRPESPTAIARLMSRIFTERKVPEIDTELHVTVYEPLAHFKLCV